MFILDSILTADTSSILGRLDYHSLSQQTLMELLIDSIQNADVLRGPRDAPKDISQWSGVKLNAAGEVTDIEWRISLKGSIALEWLPSTVSSFCIHLNKLEGTVDLSRLPEVMIDLNLTANSFSGTVPFTQLPQSLENFYAALNAFCGSLDLTALPKSLQGLSVGNNRFEGTICLTELPPRMEALWVKKNRLHGTLDLTKLPATLNVLHLHDNAFHGETDFTNLPQRLEELDLSHTDLSGTLWVPRPRRHFHVKHSQVSLVVGWANLDAPETTQTVEAVNRIMNE